jgi:hypothetical protein
MPEGRVRTLPTFGQPPCGAAWDALNRPLLLYRPAYPDERLVQLDEVRNQWKPLPLSGSSLALSPDGRYAATVDNPRSAPFRWNQVKVRVMKVPGGRLVREFVAHGPYPAQLFWADAGTLVINRDPRTVRGSQEWRLSDASLRKTARREPGNSAVQITFQSRHVPGERFRDRLRRWGLLRSAPAGLDWFLVVRDAQGRELQRIPLGRRLATTRAEPWCHTWKAAAASPDGRYVAFRAADETLRLLKLR